MSVEYILKRFNVSLAENEKPKLPIDILSGSRGDLAEIFGELGFKTGVELGVEQGLFSDKILRSSPDVMLYSIDAWTAYKGYRDHVNQEKMNLFLETTRQRLSKYGKRSKVVKGFSMDVVKDFKPGCLDFVYIDGNHGFDWVMCDIIEWSKRVRSGGIVAGHDFIRRLHEPVHVIQATHAYASVHGINPWFTIGGATKETRSWFWVKP